MLVDCPPFARWDLPPVGTLRFEVLRGTDVAEYSVDQRDRSCIAVNADMHTRLAEVIESVAHEMIHLRQDLLGRLPDTHAKQHNAEWRRMARVVCRNLGFDVQRF